MLHNFNMKSAYIYIYIYIESLDSYFIIKPIDHINKYIKIN